MQRTSIARIMSLAAGAVMRLPDELASRVQVGLSNKGLAPRLNPHATTWRANGKAVSGAAANKRAAKKRKAMRARSKK